MESVLRQDVPENRLPGRVIQWLVGADTPMPSDEMTVGLVHYSDESGPMEPHNHVEETIFVLEARDAVVRWGAGKDALTETIDLTPGVALHIPADEWHVFEWQPGGHADVIILYGTVFTYGRTGTGSPAR
jgi:mannose-6-phosphate isomerase-like protein (cupin superfamily)